MLPSGTGVPTAALAPAEAAAAGAAAAEAYEASRTEEEKAGFHYALHETMDLWYSHQGTTVYMVTQLPEGSRRSVGYDDSGWTTYERCSAEQIKKFYLESAGWKLVLDLGVADPGARSGPIREVTEKRPEGIHVVTSTMSRAIASVGLSAGHESYTLSDGWR